MNVNVNATLLEVRGPGALDAHGDPDPTGTVLWSGRARGYLKRARKQGQKTSLRSATTTERADPGLTDTFTILRTALARAVEQAGPGWEATTVLIEDQRATPPVTRRFTVQGMENRAVGSIVDSVRLELVSDGSAQ
jgi:hypothetical protein